MILTEQQIKALPYLDPPKTVRIKFRKAGRLKHISHLDLQRSMARIIARAGLPVWYTKGFNPHPKLVFGVPLPVGVESECELLDLRLDRDIPNEAVRDMLNAKLTDELCALEVREAGAKFVEISAADYSITIKTAGACNELAAEIQQMLTSSPLVIIKKSKSGEKEADIIPMINNVSAKYCADEDVVRLSVRLSCGQTENLNASAVVSALRERLGILSGDPTVEYCNIRRERFYGADGKQFV
ncbi:MAG: DUF2344 domain-containing protein [Clostridia bacterium]|nr:DUF2344 domain-containing protein [Clostridia bacterium]